MLQTNIKLTAGDSKRIVISVTDDQGRPVNITNATGKFTIGKVSQPSPEQIILQKNVGILDGPSGYVEVVLLPEDTAGISGIFLYDVELTYEDGFVETVATGRVEILGDITP